MSYNTRRMNNTPNNMAGIGQRRPIQNNFTPGGQLTPQKQPVVTPSQQQQQTGINFRNQNTPNPQQQQPKVQPQTPKIQPQTPKIQPQTPKIQPQTPQQQKTFPPPQQQQQQQPIAEPKVEPMSQTPAETPAAEGEGEITPKKFWAARKGIKISKKEKQRRRNMRLSKILQPKNAVMILNELVRSPTFTVNDVPEQAKPCYKATVVIDGVEHVGMGNGKNQAKNSAAESAIKYLIKHKRISSMGSEEGGEEKMDVDEANADGTEAPLPWQHVASFALFKLFTSWGEDTRVNVEGEKIEHRPSKVMPANPDKMQPLMLLNQMLPHAQFEEVGKTGAPPNVLFTFNCKVDEHVFQGSGSSKKVAKKMAAFAACHQILGVSYPPDVWSPLS
ncbi:unnamed protein product [Brassicogethes aeneus]|uniref:DRBM domain-containing protein n=1 Tax=Brassicogethes aeneus TaxID=1431903 RepID=A0A9P0FMQ2_BRAAE|nr:unnamed protein product [Brassicogethes aeneus]